LGENTGDLSALDQTLTDFLTVTVCEVGSGGGCTIVAEFTSQKNQGGGLDYIKLQNYHYHVNWDASKDDADKEFEIHFAVASLEVGYITHTPSTGRTVPIKFRIDNHPRIRARVLHEMGYTATEVAEVLRDEFGLGAKETAHILADEGYGVVEIAEAVRDVFGLDAQATAQILKDLGFSAVQVARALRDVFALDAQATAQILKDVGFSAVQVARALKNVFALDAQAAAQILKDLGFSVIEVARALKNVFALDAQAAAQILKDVGFSVLEIGRALRDVFALDAQTAAQILKDLGFSAIEVGLVLKDVFAQDEWRAAEILKSIGCSAKETYDVLTKIYQIDDVIQAERILYAAGYLPEEYLEFTALESIEKFAPVLKFDRAYKNLPMSAQEFFGAWLCCEEGCPPRTDGGYNYWACGGDRRIAVHRFDVGDNVWKSVSLGGPFPVNEGWDQPARYHTIQTADIDGDGQDELLGRSAGGMVAYRFDVTNNVWGPLVLSGPFSDAEGWNVPEYYGTIQAADIDGDGRDELLGRGAGGMEVYRFDVANNVWQPLILSGPFSDAEGWNAPQYYGTIQAADIDGDGRDELLGRGPEGMQAYRFDMVNSTWQTMVSSGPFADSGGWGEQTYVGTIQTADVDGDGQDEVLGRGPEGMVAYRFDVVSNSWQTVVSSGPFTDAQGWGDPDHYHTIQTGDIDGDGQDELLGRGVAGMETCRFDAISNNWQMMASNGPFSDAEGWNHPDHYGTIQTADIDGDGQDELLGRSAAGMAAYQFDVARNAWEPLGSPGPFGDGSFIVVHGYIRIQTTDVDGDGKHELLGHQGASNWNGDFNTLINGMVPTYFKVMSCPATGRLRITYWWFYGFQPACNPWPDLGKDGSHFGDWEHIMVTTTPDRSRVDAVTYYQHAGQYTRQWEGFGTVGDRPVVYVGKTQHGSYHDQTFSGHMSWNPFYCCYYNDYRNDRADIQWPWWYTNNNLVSLRSNSEHWMQVEQVDDGWRWGPAIKDCLFWFLGCWDSEMIDAVGTHPTRRSLDWNMASCHDQGCSSWEGPCYIPWFTFNDGWPSSISCPDFSTADAGLEADVTFDTCAACDSEVFEANQEQMIETAAKVVAGTLGMSVEEIKAANADGLTLCRVGEAQGMDLAQVWAATQSTRQTILQQAVDDGSVTQAQADWIGERLADLDPLELCPEDDRLGHTIYLPLVLRNR
jgi:predicted transcriptional regulator